MLRLIMKPLHIAWLLVYFLYELFNSAWRVFVEVMTPGLDATPRLVAMPLDVKTDIGITTTANLISLTPGTLTTDVSDCRQYLLIHAMYGEEGTEAVNASMKEGLEKVVIRAVE
ncbi:MAG: Na+/H+ antiporter subunit E [Pseudomonadota bacterium]